MGGEYVLKEYYVKYLKDAFMVIGIPKYSPKSRLRVVQEKVYAVDVALRRMGGREERVLRAFYGIGQERHTMAEIAVDMGLKRERIRQIRDVAVRKLRKAVKGLR